MMKTKDFLFVAAVGSLSCVSLPAMADPAGFVGLAVSFGGGNGAKFGLTAKVLSSDKQDEWVAAAGVTYYFTEADNIGFDLSAGYSNTDNVSILVGYDLVQRAPVASIGWSDTKEPATVLEIPPS
jgi:hypothetical protein